METINESKRQSNEWKKISAYHASDKGLISKHMKTYTTNNQRNKQLDLKMSRRLKQTFFQKRHTGGLQAREKMLSITILRDMLIKTTKTGGAWVA